MAAAIRDYHAHVYFDADSREPARALREAVEERFEVEMGRWHEKLVGPHPRWSYQIKFQPALFDELVPWLMLNRRGLTVFLHPNTGQDLEDHRDHPVWMGELLPLKISLFEDD
ncbi:MAG: DOPA 4,5-dioxygenase family protein [Alphaproteobacteria bacterium]|jgi:DOPA 4,5-dioxygenase|nr:DOPA 4,5-dioxygenase family protein [Alphaproteobacteria bacterium]MDP6811671.1 DOPA 4,5-dioxygenase family protein [Alphaproteobacteria bacterium]